MKTQTMALPFIKMQGIGNDFILIDDLGKPAALMSPITKELAQKICDRRFGVGADQILWLKSPQDPTADARMEILNADGSIAEMCGNGIRAVGVYLYREGPKRKDTYLIETLAGMKKLDLSPEAASVTVDMGKPQLGSGFAEGGERLPLPGHSLAEARFFEVNVGNPHAVIFVDDVTTFPVAEIGAAIELHPRFPHRTNVEFVQVKGPHEIQVRVWERGAGITLACGTGACASAVAAIACQYVNEDITVHLPGGDLNINWEGLGKSVLLKGPAEIVFRGEYFF